MADSCDSWSHRHRQYGVVSEQLHRRRPGLPGQRYDHLVFRCHVDVCQEIHGQLGLMVPGERHFRGPVFHQSSGGRPALLLCGSVRNLPLVGRGWLAHLAGAHVGCPVGLYMTLLVLTGPESTGKSTLAAQLADLFSAELVPEIARRYLSPRIDYRPEDVLRISALQHEAETQALRLGRTVVCDTDQQVLNIWWAERYGPTPRTLQQRYQLQSKRCYLLCKPDIAWQPDPQREHPTERERLYALYLADLRARGLQFAVVGGEGRTRLDQARSYVMEWLK